jgi:hypothetical protein
MDMNILVLLTLMVPLVVIGQARSDRLQDGLLGPVKRVVETSSQSGCKDLAPSSYSGTIHIIGYDQEGNKTIETYDPNYSYSPLLTYSHAADGTVLVYNTVNHSGNMPVQVLVYKIVRDYDSVGNIQKEESYRGITMVQRVEYTRDGKGRIVNAKTLHAAQPYSFDSRIQPAGDPSQFKSFSTGAIYKYGGGVFPEQATMLMNDRATGLYSYHYEYDPRGNWVKRNEAWKSLTARSDSGKIVTVTCRNLNYYN